MNILYLNAPEPPRCLCAARRALAVVCVCMAHACLMLRAYVFCGLGFTSGDPGGLSGFVRRIHTSCPRPMAVGGLDLYLPGQSSTAKGAAVHAALLKGMPGRRMWIWGPWRMGQQLPGGYHPLAIPCMPWQEGSLLKMAASSSFIGSHTETNKMRSGMPRTHTALKEVVMYLSQEGRLLESQRPFSSAWPTDFAVHVPPIS